MDRVMQVLGIDPAAATRKDAGKAYAKARTTCLLCRYGYACEGWLNAEDRLPPPDDICPNAKFFRELSPDRHAPL